MRRFFCRLSLALGCTLLLGAVGCKTVDFSAGQPKAGYGYADLYTEPATADVWWRVEVFDPTRKEFREFTAQYEAPQAGILRLQAKPGRHRARVTFLNMTALEPVEFEAEIREGMVTPIKLVMTPVGESVVRSVQQRLNRERMRIRDYPNQIWKLSAEPGTPGPFAPKEKAVYYMPSGK